MRQFIFGILIFGLVPSRSIPVLSAQERPASPADAKQYHAYLIGNAHIDPVWLWPWYEGMSVVQSTFRSALDRMNETAGFTFTASSAQFYEWVAENDPQMLSEIRKRVQEGRWDPVGGWWVEPDVNLPSGESLIRQGLYGQLTFKRLLGRMATTAYNPDSFGHPGSLPQILKLEGMNNYVFMRPAEREKHLPSDLFWWQSADGTKVLTYRIPIAYGEDKDVAKRVHDILEQVKALPQSFMAFYGAGDHGGGATKRNIESIEALEREPGAVKVKFSSPDEYFAELRKGRLVDLPVVEEDLQHHSVGCYTAESWMKKSNRTTEIKLLAAEKLAAIGSLAWGAAYPKDDFTAAWKRVLFLQFHDSLAGTALPEHYEVTAATGYGFARNIASQALYKATEKLVWQIPTTDPDSEYLVAFNLEPWPLTANLEYDLQWKRGVTGTVTDERGNELLHQWIRPTTEVNDRQRLIVRVELPAFGYRQIRIQKSSSAEMRGDVRATGQTLENSFLRLTVMPDGSIRLFDKAAGRDVFRPGESGARALVMDDHSDTWSHDVRAYANQIGSFEGVTTRLLENGPLRGCVRVRSTYENSILTTDWLLYASAHTVEARISLDWHEHQKMLKLSFPVNVTEPRSTYEIAYGSIVRQTNGDENPGQRWIDVGGRAEDNAYGLAVVNDAKYGYSVDGSDMRISMVRGAAYANHQPQVLDPNLDHRWQDQGVQTLRLLLIPHAGTWQEAHVPRVTEDFTAPTPILYQGIHTGSRPQAASFVNVDAQDVVISAIKKSEEGNDLILRCYETEGRSTIARVNVQPLNKTWSGQFGPYEIKTFRLDTRTRNVKQVNALEE